MSAADFRIIRPVTVTSAMLTSSIPDAIASTWSSGTTYALGALAGAAPVTGQAQVVYSSLQAGNLNHAQSDPAWWQPHPGVYAEYNAGTTYALNDYVSVAATHKVYISLAGGNLGNAVTDVTKWTDLGATNKWAMFDDVYQSQTYDETDIVITLDPGEVTTSIALMGVYGKAVTVTQSTGWTETKTMRSHDVLDWYDWYFEPLVELSDVVFFNIPPSLTATITITIEAYSDGAACSVFKIGRSRTIGSTQWEPTRTINDYSKTEEDDSGNITLVPGRFSKRLNVEFRVTPGMESEVTRTLEAYRATPLVFVGSEEYSMTIIYGFLGPWSVPISIKGANAYLEIKGLT